MRAARMQLVSTNDKTPASLGEYRTWEVSRETGASPRQLQWWDERGVITPRIEQKARIYTAEQLELVRRLVLLRKAGASLQQIRRLKLLYGPWKSVEGVSKPRMIGDVLVIPHHS